MEQKLISELVQIALSQLTSMGLADGTIKSYRIRAFHPLEKFYVDKRKNLYDSRIMIELHKLYLHQYERGEISKKSFNWRFRGIGIIDEIYNTGYFEWKVFSQKKKEKLADFYENIIADFINTLTCSNKRKSNYESIVRHFIVFMVENGKKDFSLIDSTFLRDFLIEISSAKSKSMDDVITALKKLFQYLNENSFTENQYYTILAAPRTRARKVRPCMDTEELALMMNCIARNTPEGKRDYAILILAATTGLRAGDIASLTLDCIDWHKNELQFIQGKTSEAILLPLQKIAGMAIADYILNARPKTGLDILFLRSCAPYTGFHDGVSVASIFRKYLKKSDLVHKTGDGRTMHGIRRMIGTEMTAEGTPVMTVSQVLGHSGMAATKYYISLDVTGMRKCTLGFDSIGGAFR